MDIRVSGILCHLSSLPSPFGIGDLGRGAYEFVDFLTAGGQALWQLLPLNPTLEVYGNSPYSSISAFAMNPLFCDLEDLVARGLLRAEELEPVPSFSAHQVDYAAAAGYKYRLLELAFERFREEPPESEYARFCEDNAYWLEDFALFAVFKQHYEGAVWNQWPEAARDREPNFLSEMQERLTGDIGREKFFQFIVARQWQRLRNYSLQQGIQIMGDMPIYVNYDSADVWAHPAIFKLDAAKKPAALAGVPPDYFSATGQLWGNPVYNWPALQERGYAWWLERLRQNERLFDLVRIDHFRGLVACWEVPAGSHTATNGQWVEAPIDDFFNAVLRRLPSLRLVAEDLGMITADVREAMQRTGFPGMKVLLFAFQGPTAEHPYAPHNYPRNCVVYTGTHDNNTARGWFEHEATEEEKQRLFSYIGKKVSAEEVPAELIRLALQSVANTAIVPLQDILHLGREARMNTPATSGENWQWRCRPGQCSASVSDWLRHMARVYGRT